MLFVRLYISMYDVTDGTSDVIVISLIRSRRSTSLLLTRSFLLSKHVLGSYTFTNINKHVFKIHMCLLRTHSVPQVFFSACLGGILPYL